MYIVTDRDMLLALDESGDAGFKLTAGSSRRLVIGGALFPDRDCAEGLRHALQSLRVTLGGKEFKFAKSAPERRTAVLAVIADYPLTFHAIVCDKARLDLRRWKRPSDLYRSATDELIQRLAPQLVGCSVVFDTLGGKTADKEHAGHIRRAAGLCEGRPRISGLKAVDSRKDLYAQMADFICGTTASQADGEATYYRQIVRREGHVIFWPEPDGETNSGPISRPAVGVPPVDDEGSCLASDPFSRGT